jgi:hypothetical protein
MVLSTDMAVHFDLLKTFAEAVVVQPSPKEWNPQTLSLTFQMLVHLADLANPSRPFPLALKWAERVITEFMQQVCATRLLSELLYPMLVVPLDRGGTLICWRLVPFVSCLHTWTMF